MCIILKNLKMGHLKLVLKAQALDTEAALLLINCVMSGK